MPRCQRSSPFPGAAACSKLLLLSTLALVQQSRFASADACRCDDSSGFRNQITGCLGTSDSPCPLPVDKSKEPLFNATLEWDRKGIKAALASGADVNGVSSSEWIMGLTPLQAALMTISDPYWHPYTEDVYAVIEILLEAGANPNTPFPADKYSPSDTPLLWAAYDGRTDMVNMMIKAGGNLASKDEDGNTPLHEAALCDPRRSWDNKAEATVKLLLALGGNLNATNKAGKTPFQVTPGFPDCAGSASDMSDCPRVCKLLRDGLSVTDKKAILAGQMPEDQSRSSARKCCKDPEINGFDYSQCCLGQQGSPSVAKAGRRFEVGNPSHRAKEPASGQRSNV